MYHAISEKMSNFLINRLEEVTKDGDNIIFPYQFQIDFGKIGGDLTLLRGCIYFAECVDPQVVTKIYDQHVADLQDEIEFERGS